MHGHCATCDEDVEIDGRAADRERKTWSHMREVVTETTVPGHVDGCWGDCDKHGCPVPVPDIMRDVVECGPVTLNFLDLTAEESERIHNEMMLEAFPEVWQKLLDRADSRPPEIYETPEGFACRRCGLSVADPVRHTEWHRSLTVAVQFQGEQVLRLIKMSVLTAAALDVQPPQEPADEPF